MHRVKLTLIVGLPRMAPTLYHSRGPSPPIVQDILSRFHREFQAPRTMNHLIPDGLSGGMDYVCRGN